MSLQHAIWCDGHVKPISVRGDALPPAGTPVAHMGAQCSGLRAEHGARWEELRTGVQSVVGPTHPRLSSNTLLQLSERREARRKGMPSSDRVIHRARTWASAMGPFLATLSLPPCTGVTESTGPGARPHHTTVSAVPAPPIEKASNRFVGASVRPCYRARAGPRRGFASVVARIMRPARLASMHSFCESALLKRHVVAARTTKPARSTLRAGPVSVPAATRHSIGTLAPLSWTSGTGFAVGALRSAMPRRMR